MNNINRSNSLLSSQARIQVPWVKVTIGEYTFGIFDEQTKSWGKNNAGFYVPYSIQFPQYITDLQVTKVNGQVNNYTLVIVYPVTQFDDPNFFEKVFSSVSRSRKIIFTYGDAEVPSYVYKNEEAIITNVTQQFNFPGSKITYTVRAVSSAALSVDGSITMPAPADKVKPSDEIKKLFKSNISLQNTFTGMKVSDLDSLIAGDDMAVQLQSKRNISAIDYINYLTSCMIPAGSEPGVTSDVYAMTIQDDSITNANKNLSKNGPYFEVNKVSASSAHEDAYEIDIGINTSTIVRSFTVDRDENYSIYYEYQNQIHPENYVRRLNADGLWEDVYSPSSMTYANGYETYASDKVWWSKATQFPINAKIQIQGLLRPASLMQYVKLNVIFPGGNKHLSSGLYIITSQVDNINSSGYATTLGLTRLKGDMD